MGRWSKAALRTTWMRLWARPMVATSARLWKVCVSSASMTLRAKRISPRWRKRWPLKRLPLTWASRLPSRLR